MLIQMGGVCEAEAGGPRRQEGLLQARMRGEAGSPAETALWKGETFEMVSPPHLFKNKKFLTARTSAACQAPFVFITEYQAGVKEINKQRERDNRPNLTSSGTDWGGGGGEVSLVLQSLRNNISILDRWTDSPLLPAPEYPPPSPPTNRHF